MSEPVENAEVSRDAGLVTVPDPLFGHRLALPPSLTKAEVRTAVRHVRRRLPPIDHESACRTLSRFLAPVFDAGRRVVIYDAMGDEVDLVDLIDGLDDPGTRLAITRTPDRGSDLSLHPWGGPTEVSPMGYRQPRSDSPVVEPEEVGALLVPALAFDRTGARLGRGAGYYDRLLARMDPETTFIGMTAGLIVNGLPVEAHDVAMTHLAGTGEVVTVG